MKLSSLIFAAAVSASPVLNRQATNTSSPCASVSSAYYAQTTATPTVSAKLALDCLNTIPLNATSAVELVKQIKPYIGWQSTLAYLKNPPAEYAEKVQSAVDILAGLDKIQAKVQGSMYKSEYEFGYELYNLIASAHDGHFSYVPDSVGLFFNFGRSIPLVSVSEDGKKAPAVFAYLDVLGASFKNISYTPSAITKINGEDAAKYLADFSQFGSLQDRDALYNNMFYELAQVSLGAGGTAVGMFAGSGRGRWIYPGENTVFTFANGTTRTIENFARILVSMRNVTSGADLAKKYITYRGSASTAANKNNQHPPRDTHVKRALVKEQEKRQATTLSPPGYPPAVIKAPGNVISCYYLNGTGFEDVVVLAVPSFVGQGYLEIPFQQAGDNCIKAAKAAGKKKLIIDISANGGGTILQGYDLFKKLFPSILPYGASRFRAHDGINQIGQAYSAAAEKLPRDPNSRNSTAIEITSSYFNYQTDTDANYKPFASWAQKYGPFAHHGDSYTNLARWNLSDVLTPINSGGINITGYGNRSSYTDQPFSKENIVIVSDGYCASTCTIFSDFMKQQAGVKTIMLGGRPSSTGQIQAIGGVKGTNNYNFGYIQYLAQLAVYNLGASKTGELGAYFDEVVFSRSAVSPGVNVRDGIREGDTEQTPLQFVYEAADCHLWYTAEMTTDVTAIWKAAADSQWNGKPLCVGGGAAQPTYNPHDTFGGFKREVSTKLAVAKSAKADRTSLYEDFMDSLSLHTEPKGLDVDTFGFMQP